MKNVILFLYINFVFIVPVISQENALLFQQANENYQKENYEQAINLYKKIEASQEVSGNLYFNIANSYYKKGQMTEAIYYYEKALSFDPKNTSYLENYAFAKQNLVDKITPLPTGVLERTYVNIMQLTSFDNWAYISVFGAFLFICSFIFFYNTSISSLRMLSFALWTIGGGIAIFGTLVAYKSQQYAKETINAIVFKSELEVKGEPSKGSENVVNIHEGTKVQIIDKIAEWKKIRLVNGKEGWVVADDLKEL